MCNFAVGDIVIGNLDSREHYRLTNDKCMCEVVSIKSNEKLVVKILKFLPGHQQPFHSAEIGNTYTVAVNLFNVCKPSMLGRYEQQFIKSCQI